MKYDALIYVTGYEKAIGQVTANTISDLKNKARKYASDYTLKSGRAVIQDSKTGKSWGVNY